MDNIIKNISLKEFNLEPSFIEPILDKGVRNKVFKVQLNNTNYIFRLNNEKNALNMFQKEKYCIDKAREANISTSTCHYIGTLDEYSYMILNYIEGVNGDDYDLDKKIIFRKLGEYANIFNSIELSGFGRDTVDLEIGFTQTWNEFYESHIQKIIEKPKLVESGVFKIEQIEKIKVRLSEMKDWNYKPHLCHGNLGPNNVIVTPDKEIFIIDWGNGAGNLAPHVEIADIIAWDSTCIYLNDFLEGYGMSQDEYKKIEHEVNNVLIIQLLDVIKWAISDNFKVLNRDFVDQSVERIMNLN
jgi:fructosamine-3-kinase